MNFSTEGVVVNTSKTFKPGVSTVQFNGVTFASPRKDGTGDPVITLNFTDGVVDMDKKLFAPNGSNLVGKTADYDTKLIIGGKTIEIKKGSTYTEAQAEAIALNAFLKDIRHLTDMFDPDMVISGNSYADLAKNLMAAVNQYKGDEVKIACEYKGQYLEIRRKRPFLAQVNDSKTLERLDLNLNRVVPDAEPDASVANDDLPF